MEPYASLIFKYYCNKHDEFNYFKISTLYYTLHLRNIKSYFTYYLYLPHISKVVLKSHCFLIFISFSPAFHEY